MRNDIKTCFCVIGDPIGQSLSPEIHHYVFQHLKLSFRYETIRVTSDQLKSFVNEARSKGRPGFNVTIPHKEAIIPFLDDIDPLASRIGAVNTVWNQKGKMVGLNTDIYGCSTALERSGWNSSGLVILLGAGGAARAVIESLNRMQIKHLILFDILQDRAEKLKNDFLSNLNYNIEVGSLKTSAFEENLKKVDLLINATPVGMTPNEDQTPIPDIHLLPQTATVFDLVPKPVMTRLIQEARKHGLRTIYGLGMLVAQALAADEIWLHQKLEDDLYKNVINHVMNLMGEHV